MKVEYTERGTLQINGLDIPISPERAASIYHMLFMLFMGAYGREIRLIDAQEDMLKEAEDILKGEDND